MTHDEMFGSAKWIDCPDGDCSPIFIRKFSAIKNEKSEIIICGLGFFDLCINGKRVSDDLLVPSASNYSYRDTSKFTFPLVDEMGFRTYVMRYDISDYLTDGENKLEVMLGTGYYHQVLRDCEGIVDYGTPKLCYYLIKQSGDVFSDSSTLCHKGYFERCNLYYGEYQNFTKVPKESDFVPSREIEPPESDYRYQIAPTDKIAEIITDIRYMGEYDGAKYYDAGKNTVGYAVFRCDKANEYFRVDYAEEIGGGYWNGIHFSEEDKYRDEFVSDGIQKEYHERFGWQGFRYFRVFGDAEPIRIDVVHSDIKVNSSFECNNETLNWLYETYVYTQLCNMHSGVPSDCPHRERLGYTGDGQLCAESAMMLLDSKEFYRKWLYDIADCQGKNTGHVQHTAPAMGGGGGPCGWGGAIIEVPYRFWKIYADKELIEEFFPKMLLFFDYLESRSENGLVVREEKDGWCLGDWLPPTPIQISETYVNTTLYIRFMEQVLEIAKAIGKEDEVSFIPDRMAKVKRAVDNAYFSFQQGAYNGDINGASCLALRVGMGSEAVKKQVVEKYRSINQYDTGIIATDVLTGYLFSIGEGQLAFDLLSNENEVSFNHMMKAGANTLWENWNGRDSRNHPMFGAVTKYLFTELLGIKQKDDSIGFENVVISPFFVEGLDRAKGHITTVNGKISVEYIKSCGEVEITVCVDNGINATFKYKEFEEAFSGRYVTKIKL